MELELDGAVDGHDLVSAPRAAVHAPANAERWIPPVHGVGDWGATEETDPNVPRVCGPGTRAVLLVLYRFGRSRQRIKYYNKMRINKKQKTTHNTRHTTRNTLVVC